MFIAHTVVTNFYSSVVDSDRVDDVQDYWRNIFTVVLAHSIIVNSWKVMKLSFLLNFSV